MKRTIRPILDNVLIARESAEEISAGGIIIPDNAKETPTMGKVVAVGPGIDGEKPPVKKGQKVLFPKYSGTQIKVDGVELLILKSEELLAIAET